MNIKPRILYLSHANADLYQLIDSVSDNRFEMVFLENDCDTERVEKIEHCQGVICAATKLTNEHLAAGRNLKIIHHQGVGWQDTTDWQVIREMGLPLALTPEGTTIGVAEHTVLLMLAAAKHLTFADREMRAGRWHINSLRDKSRELFGKTIGYIGMGRIAEAVAERLKSFGCTGIYNDPVCNLPGQRELELGLRSGSLDEVLAHADILTLHVPLTPQTNKLIGASELAKMRPNAIIVNTARGGIIDEIALLEALNNGQVLSAALDVFENEPVPIGNPLLSHPHVVVSPHISAGTQDAMRQKMSALFKNLERFFSGKSLANQVRFP